MLYRIIISVLVLLVFAFVVMNKAGDDSTVPPPATVPAEDAGMKGLQIN